MPTDPRTLVPDRVHAYIDHRWGHSSLAGQAYDLHDPERRRQFEAWLSRIVYEVLNGWEHEE